MRKSKQRGGAVVEFFLLFPFLASLICGTLMYGTQLIKQLELQQVVRDTASMSARGTNFKLASNQAIVSRLGRELGWPDSGGLLSTSPGVVYVSTIEYLDSTCNGAVPVCSNKGNWVFVRSVAFGNTSLRHSNFGAPASCVPACYDPNQNDGSLLPNDTLNNPAARVSGFNYLGTPATGTPGFQPGQVLYLVEAAGISGPWNGGQVTYAFSIF